MARGLKFRILLYKVVEGLYYPSSENKGFVFPICKNPVFSWRGSNLLWLSLVMPLKYIYLLWEEHEEEIYLPLDYSSNFCADSVRLWWPVCAPQVSFSSPYCVVICCHCSAVGGSWPTNILASLWEKRSSWFPTRSHTTRAVQSQKMA